MTFTELCWSTLPTSPTFGCSVFIGVDKGPFETAEVLKGSEAAVAAAILVTTNEVLGRIGWQVRVKCDTD